MTGVEARHRTRPGRVAGPDRPGGPLLLEHLYAIPADKTHVYRLVDPFPSSSAAMPTLSSPRVRSVGRWTGWSPATSMGEAWSVLDPPSNPSEPRAARWSEATATATRTTRA